MAYPSKLLNEGERIVVSTRTHPKALVLPALLTVAFCAGLLWTLRGGVTAVEAILLLVGAVVVLWWALRPFLAWLTTSYTFTNRRFIKRSGLVAKEGRTIPLNRISGVDFEIGVVDRIFGCGTLVVSDASSDGRVELHDIPRVEQVQLLVADELHHLSDGSRSDDGT